MKKIVITQKSLDDINNEPIKLDADVLGNYYWLIVRNKLGDLVVEKWCSDPDKHYQGRPGVDWENGYRTFYPKFEQTVQGKPCVLYLYEKRIRQYSMLQSAVKEQLNLDEIYATIRECYPGWEIDDPGNRVHSEIAWITRKGEIHYEPTDMYTGVYEIYIPKDVDILAVNYTNTGKGSSKVCFYTRGTDRVLAKHVKKLAELRELISG